jgi:ABC-type spermidine/putrescine transport system permease subunit I
MAAAADMRAVSARSWWKALSPTQRRRILFGSLLAVSLAARDWFLLAVVGGMAAFSELAPARAPGATPT